MRKTVFNTDEYYHIFNRGVDKRTIFQDRYDFGRFFQSVEEFNTIQPIGSIYEKSFQKDKPLGSLASKQKKLVELVCYCLNPNHYHFILKQAAERGVEKFMHRLGTGYTKYFNIRHQRNGALFQGSFKAKYIDSNEYLLYVSAYVNLNFKVHQLGSLASKSSWNEYTSKKSGLCSKNIILSQFRRPSEYEAFAKDALKVIREHRGLADEIQPMLIE